MPAAYLTTAAYAVLVARKDTTSPLRCVCLAAFVNVALDWIAVGVMGRRRRGGVGDVHRAVDWLRGDSQRGAEEGFTDAFPWGELRWKGQLAPVMAFAGPITFLVFALLSIYTALILFANSLGVVVSAAHRIAGNIFAVAVLCGRSAHPGGPGVHAKVPSPRRYRDGSPRGRWRRCCARWVSPRARSRPSREARRASSRAARSRATRRSSRNFAR